jgi:hypothetical protein
MAVEIRWWTGGMEKGNCNNHEMKKLESFKWLESKIVRN